MQLPKKSTQWILKQLEEASNRRVTFETVVALVSPKGKKYFFSGKLSGNILKAARANVMPQPNMPYSTIFKPDGLKKVFAEMTVEEENRISHRGKAFEQVRAFLEALL